MAISPPSDILLDVANAADPAKVRVATAKLAKLANDPAMANSDFGDALKAAGRSGTTLSSASTWHPAISGPKTSARPSGNAGEAYQKFEAVLLQNFVESMLPKDDDLYGDKASAGVYRSMMAEQFANQISKAGGIGIAKSIAAKHPAHAAVPASGLASPIKPTDA